MQQAIGAYRQVAATDEFKEIERLRSRARHSEASAIRHAQSERDIEIAKNLLADGDSVEKISRVTGLTAAEVEGLRN